MLELIGDPRDEIGKSLTDQALREMAGAGIGGGLDSGDSL
jgi:hypothetical protein